VRTFCGQEGRGEFFKCGRPHFLAQKTLYFSKFTVCPHGQGGEAGFEAVGTFCGQGGGGQFIAILCGCLLWTAPYCKIYHGEAKYFKGVKRVFVNFRPPWLPLASGLVCSFTYNFATLCHWRFSTCQVKRYMFSSVSAKTPNYYGQYNYICLVITINELSYAA